MNAVDMSDTENPAAAVRMYRRLLNACAPHVPQSFLRVMLAWNLYRLGRFCEAEETCQTAIEACPDNVLAWQMKGLAIMAQIEKFVSNVDLDQYCGVDRLIQHKVSTWITG